MEDVLSYKSSSDSMSTSGEFEIVSEGTAAKDQENQNIKVCTEFFFDKKCKYIAIAIETVFCFPFYGLIHVFDDYCVYFHRAMLPHILWLRLHPPSTFRTMATEFVWSRT